MGGHPFASCVVACLGLWLSMPAIADETRPTVYMVCLERCVIVNAIAGDVKVDLVVIGDDPNVRLKAAGDALRIKRCDDAKARWCAKNITLSSVAKLAPGAGISGPTMLVVGPNVIDAVPIIDESSAKDTFDDVVLVGGERGFRCTGVVIDPRHVLTAAHCVPATHVGLGAKAEQARRLEVTASVRHDIVDAAVLTLAQPVDVAVRPRRGRYETSPPAGEVRILGYGIRDPLRFTGFGERRQVDMIIDGWGCDPKRAAKLGCQPAAEMYLRDPAGNDTCFGDSGGPVFEATPDGWRLLAITSRGTTPRRVLCGEGGIYVRIDPLARWLEEVTR